ncbi:MAG TPA: hypothetical protein VN931_00040, partial [Fibrobacteria bacterium]|nr:hypothetical protein [Fibrobacteria bacterium]
GSTTGAFGGDVGEGAGTGVDWRFDDPNQSSAGLAGFGSTTGALGGAVGEGVGTGVDWRFDDPNQSSAGLAGFGSTTGALGGDAGEGAETGVDWRFEDPNQSSTGVGGAEAGKPCGCTERRKSRPAGLAVGITMVGSPESISCATVPSSGRCPTGDRGGSAAGAVAGNSWKMAARNASFCSGTL